MEDNKKVVLIGGGQGLEPHVEYIVASLRADEGIHIVDYDIKQHGIGLSVPEAIALSEIPYSGVEVVNIDSLPKLTEQLKSLAEREIKLMESINILNEPDCKIEKEFKTKTKGYQRPYKFHK